MDKIAKLEAENKQIRSITLEKISEISEGRQVGKLKKYPSKSPAACEGSSPRFNDRNIEEIERLKEKLFQAE